MTLAQPESTDNKCSDDQFIGESGSCLSLYLSVLRHRTNIKKDTTGKSGSQHVSQRNQYLWEECESQTLINFVLKLAEARLSRPFVGPTREHTVSFSSDEIVWMFMKSVNWLRIV